MGNPQVVDDVWEYMVVDGNRDPSSVIDRYVALSPLEKDTLQEFAEDIRFYQEEASKGHPLLERTNKVYKSKRAGAAIGGTIAGVVVGIIAGLRGEFNPAHVAVGAVGGGTLFYFLLREYFAYDSGVPLPSQIEGTIEWAEELRENAREAFYETFVELDEEDEDEEERIIRADE